MRIICDCQYKFYIDIIDKQDYNYCPRCGKPLDMSIQTKDWWEDDFKKRDNR